MIASFRRTGLVLAVAVGWAARGWSATRKAVQTAIISNSVKTDIYAVADQLRSTIGPVRARQPRARHVYGIRWAREYAILRLMVGIAQSPVGLDALRTEPRWFRLAGG